jgi:hypothetical protein
MGLKMYAQALLTNIRLGQKFVTVTKALVFNITELIMALKSFYS